MAGNVQPIYSKVADVQWSQTLTTAAADYLGLSPYNTLVYKADPTNGGYLERLRFKADSSSNNVATVARVYLCPSGVSNLASLMGGPATPTGTPSSSGGTLLSGTYYYKIVAVDSIGSLTTVSSESTGQAVTGPTGSVAVAWTAVTGASSYRIYVGNSPGQETGYFTSSTNSFSHISPLGGTGWTTGFPTNTNCVLYDEISLPATTAAAATALPTIDLPMSFAVPPGYQVLVGLGTTVAGGWTVTAIAGKY